MNEINQLLRSRNIRPTPIRTGILSLLKKHSRRAFSNADLERAFDYTLDRVSLYRCLLMLTNANLIRRHVDEKGACSYFYVPIDGLAPITQQTDRAVSDDYPHFKCSHCETVIPLPKLPEAYLTLVRPYQLESLRVQAEGTCDECRKHPD